ncbi:hypothetical protein LUZ63_003808 [Rhynchospora breviuscula]|uniref:Uncharacterized protein n=1 Tax=Rhynchospora breviuscula TaxID=2022672 RepID=A0A9Q0D2P2_9POAL|nr:hypothetical protein LUZ63_003808 [Rhynchospora breviuscula]
MLCESRLDLLCAVMYALDLLEVDVQRATATCCNGFKFDIFQAKQCKDGQLWKPEDIKSVLMLCARGHDLD